MKVGLFPGTFDPVTLGHLDILERALQIFDRMVVAIAHQHHKQTLFDVDERVAMFREALPASIRKRVTVTAFTGLLVEFARAQRVAGVVRGLRFVSDFEYEFQMALMNQKLEPDLTTFFLMPSEKFTYLNATLVKDIARSGGKVGGLVPAPVAKRLRARFRAVPEKRAVKGARRDSLTARPKAAGGKRRSAR